jgi:hypothetical protein
MNQTLQPDFDELGVQLGRALRDRVASQGVRPIGIDPVLAGVGRRRARRRGGVIVVCIALIAAAGVALTTRIDESVPGDDGGAPIDRPAMLPAYAILAGAPGVGDPVSMFSLRGGSPMGTSIPAIDVWTSGERRLVIRTVDNSQAPVSSGVTTSVVATTAAATGFNKPWGERGVAKVQVRGVDGAIEELASDQFAIWIPTTSPERYTVVIARGMSRANALAEVDSLADLGGVLEPSTGFTAIERSAALPATTASPAYASAAYSFFAGPYVATYSALPGRSSIETIAWTGIGRLASVNGRDVMFDDNPQNGSFSATWIDSTGAVVSVVTRDGNATELVPFVHIVDEAGWLRLSNEVSAEISRSVPAVDEVSLGSTKVVRRLDDHRSALCAVVDGTEACVADSSGDSPVSLANHADVNGHWIFFGYREILPEEESYLTADDLTFTSSSGSCCDVESTTHNGAIWFVVHVDDDVDVIDTNVGNVFGGVVGSISRPSVASNI